MSDVRRRIQEEARRPVVVRPGRIERELAAIHGQMLARAVGVEPRAGRPRDWKDEITVTQTPHGPRFR